MTQNRTPIIIAAASVFLLLNSLFTVKQSEQAMIMQFGEATKVITEPGLKIKIPFIQSVKFFNKKLLSLVADQKEVLASDQKRLVVDAFAKYRITKPLEFYKTVRDENGARMRLNSMLESSLRSSIAAIPLSDLLTEKRAAIMASITRDLNRRASEFGVHVADVRIMRADLPNENSMAIYQRMRTDREKEAKEFRARGAEEAQVIKATADKERRLIIAEAEKKAQIVKGEGDKIATKTYAETYGKDREFFNFYRSLEAYKTSLKKDNTKIVIGKDSEFLQHMK